MRRIREVLRLRDEFGASQRQIADACTAAAQHRARLPGWATGLRHRPGTTIEVDYAGMTPSVGLGAEAQQAQVFVACLPYSGYVYAEATWTQQAEEWLASHVRLFEHLGGVPGKLVPDNLKVGVSHASFYDPAINPAYHDLARHYRTAVLPPGSDAHAISHVKRHPELLLPGFRCSGMAGALPFMRPPGADHAAGRTWHGRPWCARWLSTG